MDKFSSHLELFHFGYSRERACALSAGPPSDSEASTFPDPEKEFLQQRHEANLQKLRNEALTDPFSERVGEDFMARSCRGLAAISKDIQTRCADHVCESSFRYVIRMWRVDIHKVDIRSDEKMQLATAKIHLVTRSFGSVPSLPQELGRFLAMGGNSRSIGIPDYEPCIWQALAIQDQIEKIGFLNVLKHHLHDLHMFWARIETWLRKPLDDVLFLKRLFGTTIVLPNVREGSRQSRLHHLATFEDDGCSRTLLWERVLDSAPSDPSKVVVDEYFLNLRHHREALQRLSLSWRYTRNHQELLLPLTISSSPQRKRQRLEKENTSAKNAKELI